jgi:hypothetical protein
MKEGKPGLESIGRRLVVNESLDALLLAYRTLLTISIAILALALGAARRANPFREALVELRQIEPAAELIGQMQIEQTTEYYRNLLNLLKEKSPELDLSKARVLTGMTEDSPNVGLPRRPLFAANSSEPIEAYYEWLRVADRFDSTNIIVFDDDLVADAISRLAKDNKITMITSIYIMRLQKSCLLIMIDGENSSGEQLSNIDAQIELNMTEELLPFPPGAISMLTERKILDNREGKRNALPALRAIWDVVQGKDMRQLSDILERRAEEEDQKATESLSIFGVSVPPYLAVVVGPATLIALSVEILALTDHVSAHTHCHGRAILEFPLPGMIVSAAGRLSYFGVFAVALLSGAIILVKAIPSTMQRGFALLVFGGTLLTLHAFIVIRTGNVYHSAQIDLKDQNEIHNRVCDKRLLNK